ncbi:MAG TPA: RNA-binding protein [Anaerolineales bacterium]|nr:RNA-binding protein [Anaerolineales bacterium]
MEFKLYVGNLAFSTTEEQLQTLFAQAGTVVSAAIIRDRDSGMSRGFAFVGMSSLAEAQKAITMFNAYNLDDRELKVNMAKPREERSGGGGYGGGGGGGGYGGRGGYGGGGRGGRGGQGDRQRRGGGGGGQRRY